MNTTELTELKNFARRNSYHVHGDPHKADCVIAFSFGFIQQEKKILPGKSNVQLARFIEQRFPGMPLIAQSEIADALQKSTAVLTITSHRTPGKYLDSGEVAAQAVEYMKTKGWTQAIIITHPALEARNDYVCVAIGMETIAPSGLDTIEYDELSAQLWTRNAKAWWTREEGVIDLCNQNGWLKKPSS